MTTARSTGKEAAPPDDPQHQAHFHEARAAQARVLLEDYVELIAELLPDAGANGRAATVGPSLLARHLGVSHASAIKCIARLCRSGLAHTEPYRGVGLTEAGYALAASVRRRHRIVLGLLTALGVPAASAEADAEGIEHHVSPQTLLAFERFLAENGGCQ